MMFQPPPESIIWETGHWRVNHCIGTTLPGYLIVGALTGTDWDALTAAAWAEMGDVLKRAIQVITDCLHPQRIYVSRYGHTPGHTLHFHLIPVYDCVLETYLQDERYRALEQFYAPGSGTDPDGAELTLFIWREYGEAKRSPAAGMTVSEAIPVLRQAMVGHTRS